MSVSLLAAEGPRPHTALTAPTGRTRTTELMAAAAGAAVFAGLAIAAGTGALGVVRLAVLGGALAAIAVADAVQRRVPNRIVLPAAAVCAGLALAAGPHLALLGALGLVALLLALSLRRPGKLGMGDVKLVLLIAVGLDGDVLGPLLLGIALVVLAGLVLLVRDGRSAWQASLPLAPFLAAGVLGALLVSSLA